jgi:periplasmic divalent cation tolerance protein
MTNSDCLVLVLSNWPDSERARAAARTLVEERLAACVNLVPAIESIYRWQGSVETASEVMMLAKTISPLYPQLERRLKELHPYEVPEILAFNASDGLGAYVGWVQECCGKEISQ